MKDQKHLSPVNDGTLIKENGWSQGSIFTPSEINLKVRIPFDDASEKLIICTQACSVVLPDLDKDPTVEAMVIELTNELNHDKATGKNQRQLQIELLNSTNYKAIECNIHRRFFFDRKLLCQGKPDSELSIGEVGSGKLAGWIGRYYTRIALPDELVNRLKMKALDIVKKELKRKIQGQPDTIHSKVSSIYIYWTPEGEADSGEIYVIEMLFICENIETSNQLDPALLNKLSAYLDGNEKDGLQFKVEVKSKEEVMLSDIDKFYRLSEWDYFSDLGEIGGHLSLEDS